MLFNKSLFNTGLFDGSLTSNTVYSSDYVVFEGFSLSDNANLITQDIAYSGPTTSIQGGSVPRDHGEYTTARYFRENTIEIRGFVKAASGALMDAELDTIRKNLRKREGNLDLTDLNGTAKRFVATVDNFESMFTGRKGFHVTICPFVIRFKCRTPFGRARSYSYSSSVLTSSGNISAYHAGTTAGSPLITLAFDSASSVTTVDVKRLDSNGATLEEIQYIGTVASGDIVVFDSEQKAVRKNSTSLAYSGGLLTIDAGTNLFSFTIDGTFTCTATVAWKTTYL